MSFITNFLIGITDAPKEDETAQEARDNAVKAGFLPPSQSPHIKPDEIAIEPDTDDGSVG